MLVLVWCAGSRRLRHFYLLLIFALSGISPILSYGDGFKTIVLNEHTATGLAIIPLLVQSYPFLSSLIIASIILLLVKRVRTFLKTQEQQEHYISQNDL